MTDTSTQDESTPFESSDCSRLRAIADRFVECTYNHVHRAMVNWSQRKYDDAVELAEAWIAEHPSDDDEPITGEWLLSLGCELVPCNVHGTPNTDYEFDSRIQFWQFNDTDEWLTVEPEIALRTRRDVRDVIRILGVK